MTKYRIRKLVNGTYRVDEKYRHTMKIPFMEWWITLPFSYWEARNSTFRTEQEAESFIQTVVRNRNGLDTLANETRYFSDKGERVVDSWL